MNLANNNSQKPISFLTWGMTAIFLVSAGLRFWQLGRFNTLVFDEVYYAKFANNYLTQTEFFNAHPPLSQYLIAISIWIGSHLPFGQEFTNDLTGSTLAPWTYRWLNALTGSFIPVVVGAIAYQLTRRSSYALISSLLMAADGLFLVESRYALNNIYLVIFGLLGHLCLLLALKNRNHKQWIWLTLSGICCGFSASIKWNGLGLILGIFLVFIVAAIVEIIDFFELKKNPIIPNNFYRNQGGYSSNHQWRSPLSKLSSFGLAKILITLGFLPGLCYSLIWIPHLILNPQFDFVEMQEQIMGYHQSIEDGKDVHPYCSEWYSWPFMLRPIVYFYKNTAQLEEPDPSLPPIAAGSNGVIFDIHAMGNPILWWLSTLAIFLLLLILISRFGFFFKYEISRKKSDRFLQLPHFPANPEMWLLLYLVMNWMANFLPWAKVSRCIFLYHYMSSYVFAILALGWWLDRWFRSRKTHLKLIAILSILLVLLAFNFWLPVYLGLPLSPLGWKIRMWFISWS